MSNVFVVGLDPFNRKMLEGIGGAERIRFIQLLGYEEAARPPSGRIEFNRLLKTAEARLADFNSNVDAIIGYWDFPTSSLVPTLSRRQGLAGPSLETVAACEHKLWSRIEQSRAVPGLVPNYCSVDPFADDPQAQIDIACPFWIKPVKAHSSYLGFRIERLSDLDECLPRIREGIGNFGEAFNSFLSLVDVPEEVAGVGGNHCIAEEIISSGRQCTLEGFVWRNEVTVYGIVDSIRAGRKRSSFSRYQYPSGIPRETRSRMVDAAARVMRQIGYDGAPFNMEFFWDQERGRISLLEVNPRISKSHCPLFALVDGVSHQQVAVDLALGRKPSLPRRQGEYAMAAKFMVRVHVPDGYVRRMPTCDELERVEQRFPEIHIRLLAKQGMRLSDLSYQDSYSFELAELFIGGYDKMELLEKYRACLEMLSFDTDEMPEAA